MLKRSPVISFFILAYVFTWACSAPKAIWPEWPALLRFLGSFGPAGAAFVVVALTQGAPAARQLLGRLVRWRVGGRWWLAALGSPLALLLLGLLFYRLGYGAWLPIQGVARLPVLGLGAYFFLYNLLVVWGEELGWRGYALPRLQQRLTPLAASLVLGLVWTFWHLPAFFTPGSTQQQVGLGMFTLATLAYSLLYSWIFNGSGGSVLLTCMLHAAQNALVLVLFAVPELQPLVRNPLPMLLAQAVLDGLILAWTRLRLGAPAAVEPGPQAVQCA